MSVEYHFVDHTPHFKTLTASGNSHFSRVSDALAEFVDNSLQATKSFDERKIHIDILLCSTFGCVAVTDNGIGMGLSEIQQFATYSLDQEARGKCPDARNTSMISRYGVGAKQGGFYLGDDIRIITTKDKGTGVLEFNLNEEEFNRRNVANEEVYRSEIRRRPTDGEFPGISNHSRMNSDVMVAIEERLKGYESIYQHFTSVVIRLRRHVAQQMCREGNYFNILTELAEIYYFHLHPEHSPNKIVLHEKFKAAQGHNGNRKSKGSSRGIEELKTPTVLKGIELKECSTPRLLVNFSVDGVALVEEHDLGGQPNVISRYIEEAKWAYRFNVQIPEPIPEVIEGATQELRKLHSGGEHSTARVHNVEGILFYYPFEGGRETRPERTPLLCEDDSDPGDEAGTALSKEGELDVPTFDIFWQHRLVPESKVSSLSFFPKGLRSAHQCEAVSVSVNWRRRLRGFLFFDAEFTHISNNKLKIQLDPDIDRWINEKRRVELEITYKPVSIHTEFRSWLKACHIHLDQEYIFEDRITDRSPQKGGGRSRKNNDDNKCSMSRFLTVVVGCDRYRVKANDVVKLHKSAGKGTKSKKVEYGRVKYFEVEEYMTPFQSSVYGKPTLVYQREPEVVFGTAASSAPLSAVDFSDYKVTAEELKCVVNDAPAHIRMLVFEAQKASEKGTEIDGDFECRLGQFFHKWSFQIRNKSNRELVGRPMEAAHRYKVRLSIGHVSLGITSELKETDPLSLEDVSVPSESLRSKAKLSGYYYVFPNIRLETIGEHQIRIEVLDESRAVLSRDLVVAVKPKPVSAFRIEGDFSGRWKLGSFMPGMRWLFLDDQGNRVPFTGIVKTIMSAPGLDISCENDREPDFLMEDDDDGCLEFFADQWLVVPAPAPDPFLDGAVVTYKDVTVAATCSLCPNFASSFVLNLGPGLPVSIIQLDCDSTPTLVNGGDLPCIRFAVYDKYSNRCCPDYGCTWTVRTVDCGLLLGQDYRAVVQGNGEVEFRNIRFSCDELITSRDGLLVKQSFVLECSDLEGQAVMTDVTVRITASSSPTALEVLCNGEILGAAIVMKAGSVMGNMSLRLICDDGSELPISLCGLDGKSTGVWTSWAKKKSSKTRLSTHANLPDIEVPSVIVGAQTDYEVEVKLRTSTLHTSFTVNLLPDDPIRVTIVTDDDATEVVSGDHADFEKKIKGICLQDQYGNYVAWPSSFAEPILELRTSVQEEISGDLTREVFGSTPPPSQQRDDSEYEWTVVPTELSPVAISLTENSQSASASSKFTSAKRRRSEMTSVIVACEGYRPLVKGLPLPCARLPYKLLVRARHANSCLESHLLLLNALPGKLSRVLISANSLSVTAPVSELEVNVTSWMEIADLTMHLVDDGGNLVPSHSLKSITLEIRVNEGSIIFSRKNLKSSMTVASINLKKVIDDIGTLDRFVVECGANYSSTIGSTVLTSAKIVCHLRKLNIVKKLMLCLTDSSASVENTFEIPCTSHLPPLNVKVATEDMKPFIPDLSSITVSMRKSSTKSLSPLSAVNIADYFEISIPSIVKSESEPNDFAVCLTFPSVAKPPLPVGSFVIEVEYEENRDTLPGIPPTLRKVSGFVGLVICPGDPVRLAASARSLPKLQDVVVSNLSDADEKDRTIATDIEIYASDAASNPCGIPPETVVFCFLSTPSLENMASGVDLPRLVGADEGGYLLGQKKCNKAKCDFYQFQTLVLMPGVGRLEDGTISLVFSTRHVSGRQVSGIEGLVFPVQFMSDQSRIRRSLDIKEKMGPLTEAVELFRTRYKTLQEGVKKRESCLGSMIAQASRGLLKTFQSQPEQLSSEEIRRLKNDLTQQLSDMSIPTSKIRPAKKPENFTNLSKVAGIPVRGLVCDLGYVDDEDTAYIMSWAASTRIDAMVTTTSAAAKQLFDDGVKAWPLDGIGKFKIRASTGMSRHRSKEEIQEGSLPLPPITWNLSEPVAGNPKYMVNLIQLEQDKEHLRDTIFYRIYLSSILFDDLETAMKYRSIKLKEGGNIDNLYTRDGKKISSDGLMDPKVGHGNIPKDLKFVFGAQPAHTTLEYKEVKKDLQLASEMEPLVAELEPLKAEVACLDAQLPDILQKERVLSRLAVELGEHGR